MIHVIPNWMWWDKKHFVFSTYIRHTNKCEFAYFKIFENSSKYQLPNENKTNWSHCLRHGYGLVVKCKKLELDYKQDCVLWFRTATALYNALSVIVVYHQMFHHLFKTSSTISYETPYNVHAVNLNTSPMSHCHLQRKGHWACWETWVCVSIWETCDGGS